MVRRWSISSSMRSGSRSTSPPRCPTIIQSNRAPRRADGHCKSSRSAPASSAGNCTGYGRCRANCRCSAWASPRAPTLSHFYKFGRSPESTLRVLGLLTRYGFDLIRYGRSQALVNGNALIARLAQALFKMGTPVWTFSPATDLITENDRVVGAIVNRNGRLVHVTARRGVVLSSGGFAHNVERRSEAYSHPARADEHISLTAPGNVGDGARMAEKAGGYVAADIPNSGAWMPISRVPRPDGTWGPILHSVSQGKPGMIAVLRNGLRFADESVSYRRFCRASDCQSAEWATGRRLPDLRSWRVREIRPRLCQAISAARQADQCRLSLQGRFDPRTHRRDWHRSGRARQDRDRLQCPRGKRGEDPEFGKGSERLWSLHRRTADNPNNPNVAPLTQGPFYAVWMYAGDIGNFAGIKTDGNARVLRKDGSVVDGLFAVGNDMASIFRGRYPGGGALIGPAMTFGFTACAIHRCRGAR